MAEPLCVLFPNVKIETSSQTDSFIKLKNEDYKIQEREKIIEFKNITFGEVFYSELEAVFDDESCYLIPYEQPIGLYITDFNKWINFLENKKIQNQNSIDSYLFYSLLVALDLDTVSDGNIQNIINKLEMILYYSPDNFLNFKKNYPDNYSYYIQNNQNLEKSRFNLILKYYISCQTEERPELEIEKFFDYFKDKNADKASAQSIAVKCAIEYFFLKKEDINLKKFQDISVIELFCAKDFNEDYLDLFKNYVIAYFKNNNISSSDPIENISTYEQLYENFQSNGNRIKTTFDNDELYNDIWNTLKEIHMANLAKEKIYGKITKEHFQFKTIGELIRAYRVLITIKIKTNK